MLLLLIQILFVAAQPTKWKPATAPPARCRAPINPRTAPRDPGSRMGRNY